MKILVFGAGAIGSAFGGFLSKNHEVTLLGREDHMEAIRKNGLFVTGIWGRHRFRFKELVTCMHDLDKSKPFDLILCTVKSYSTAKAASLIKQVLGPKTLVVSLQNGLGNIEALCHVLPRKQVLAGRVIFGVELKKPGKIHVSVIAAPTAVGEILQKKMTLRIRQIAKIFNDAKLPSTSVKDVRSLLWSKVIYNAALNPLASLLGTHYGYLGEHESTRATMEAVMEEIYAVAKKARIVLQPRSLEGYKKLFYGKLLPRTYHHHPSMLQDLQRGKQTEIDALNGMVVQLGKQYRVSVPMNMLLTQLIKSEEKKHSSS
ncbi:MAG TPA: 2-dehydropantoate 2-reductase [Candidatus Omnitrophota bacterium]|nr:2-dehydropantoate 2-reductase [Candidatus Omnitrophota bacterium]